MCMRPSGQSANMRTYINVPNKANLTSLNRFSSSLRSLAKRNQVLYQVHFGKVELHACGGHCLPFLEASSANPRAMSTMRGNLIIANEHFDPGINRLFINGHVQGIHIRRCPIKQYRYELEKVVGRFYFVDVVPCPGEENHTGPKPP